MKENDNNVYKCLARYQSGEITFAQLSNVIISESDPLKNLEQPYKRLVEILINGKKDENLLIYLAQEIINELSASGADRFQFLELEPGKDFILLSFSGKDKNHE